MTKEELVTLVGQFLEGGDASFTANIEQFIRLCEDEIYREVQLPDLRKLNDTPITTTSSNRYINVPDDYLSAYYMAVLDSGHYYPLLSKDESFMREVYGSINMVGRPRFFAQLSDEQFILGPTPDSAYTIELEYFYKPTSLADGADNGTTWLSEKAEGALLYGTILQGYIYLKGDQDVVASYKDKYAQAVADLKLIAEGRDRKDSFRTSDKRLPV